MGNAVQNQFGVRSGKVEVEVEVEVEIEVKPKIKRFSQKILENKR